MVFAEKISCMKNGFYFLAIALCAGASSLGAPIEKFGTQETAIVSKPAPAAAGPVSSPHAIVVRPGEVVQVFAFQDSFGVPREAFYVPIEGTRVVQLFLERQGRADHWYVKGRARGRTVGGIVPRAWLDASGFLPRSLADEVRIQAAIKAQPIYIEVP
jgi:hypothetical protein